MPGKFISIEGGDGAGKSTQIMVIENVLVENNIEYLVTREPGGTSVGEVLRDLLLKQRGHPLSDETELLLMFAARAEHLQTVIEPALTQGMWVVSDRFHDASFAYQGARGVPQKRIQQLADWVLQGFAPDLTLLFDLPIEQGLQRVGERGELDRFEQESLDYKSRVRQIYHERSLSEPERFRCIDASVDIGQVSQQVSSVLQKFIESVGGKS